MTARWTWRDAPATLGPTAVGVTVKMTVGFRPRVEAGFSVPQDDSPSNPPSTVRLIPIGAPDSVPDHLNTMTHQAGTVGDGPALTDEALPEIPGGWRTGCVSVADRFLELHLPADPDRFLDDPAVLAANRRDDYMPYWPYLWPTSETLAQALSRAGWPAETEVLELGCGLGLVGLAGLLHGWRVTFSDHDPNAVRCALLNARRNGLAERASGLVLDWRRPLERRWPVILGSDLTYEPQTIPSLVELLSRMLAPGGVCWIGDPGRTHAGRFFQLAQEQGFHVRIQDAAGLDCLRPTPARFQMFVLRRE